MATTAKSKRQAPPVAPVEDVPAEAVTEAAAPFPEPPSPHPRHSLVKVVPRAPRRSLAARERN